MKAFLASVGILLALTACGESPPQGWNANLDLECKPQDPVDKSYAFLSPETFWRLQEYDMGSMLLAGQKNLEMSKQVLEESQSQKGDYFSRAEQAARDLGLTGKDKREHVKENMDRYNKEVEAIAARIKNTEEAVRWIRKCQKAVEVELRRLKLSPVPYDPEKRPM